MRVVDSALRGRRSLAVAVPIAMVATALALPVVANAASTVPTGGYSGTSDAYNGATVEFQIDDDGRMTGFNTESYLFCGGFPTPIQWAEQPPLQVSAGSSFTQEWTFSDVEYELSGVIAADGAASGTGVAKMPSISCSGFDFNWTATADEDPVVIDPEVSVSPGEVTVSELADSGVTVSGTGFAADASVSLTVGGVDGGSQMADADGDVSFVFTGELAAGSHAVVLSSADGDAETTLTVVEDPVVIDPEVSVSPGEVTVSELADSGVTVSGSGFAADASVSLTIGGVDGGSQTADADGDVSFVFAGELAAGSHAVVLSSADGDAETTLTVVADPVVVDPEASVSPSEVTVSELAGAGVTVSGTGFAADASVSLTVGGVAGGSQTADADGDVSFVFAGELAAGSHAVVLNSADGDAETTLTVVDDPVVIDPEASVSPDEVTVSELAGAGVTVSGAGFAADASVSLTVGGVDGGNQTADTDGNVSFVFTGDLAAGSHTVVLSSADGDAETTLTVVEDPVVLDPVASVSPSEVTVSELADSGVTVSGTGFAADASVSLTVGGVDGGSQTADADGNVSFVFAGELAAGSHAVVLSSAEGDAETTLTVVADPVVLDPEASVSPGEVTVSELADSGVTVSGSGFAADASVSLTVGGVDGGSQTADADGNVSFVFTGELAAGSHAVVLSSAEGDAETTLTVVEDATPGLPEQIPVEAPSEDELTADNRGEVSVPETADEGAQIDVRIADAQPGDVVGVWLFSTPQYLGTFTVSDDLTVTVTLPQGVTGLHRVVVYGVDEVLQGWDELIIAPVEETVPVPEDGESQLPATGGDSGAALGAALVLLLGGALMLFVRRLRPAHRG